MVSKPLKSVALLVDPSDEFLEKLLSSSRVDYIQLHGEESPERVDEIARITNIPLIKAIGVEKKSDLLNIRNYESSVDYILLDSKAKENGHLKGGRGISFNWNIIKGFNFKNHGLKPIRIHIWHDWIFVNINGKAKKFEEYAKPLISKFKDLDLTKIKYAATLDFGKINTNWKFLIENLLNLITFNLFTKQQLINH